MSMEKKLYLATQLLDFLEEEIENTCADIQFEEYRHSGTDPISVFQTRIGILTGMTDKEYLEQLEDNLRLVADKVKEFKESVG